MIKTRYKDYLIIKNLTNFWQVYTGCLCLAVGLENLQEAIEFVNKM